MQTWEAITSRRNVRSFTSQPIPAEHLEQILEAGRRSPSSQNWQPWDFILVTDRHQLRELAGESLALARSLAAGATRALGAAKRLVWSGLGARVEAQLPEEARTVAELSGTADALEGLAAVIERRAPSFGGR